MHNSTYKLLKDLKKSASAMQGGSFLPPEPLPNSVKAKQIEQQEMAEEAAASTGDPMAQMQKAQQDAVNQVSQLQQQLQQTQGELQAMQMQTQQQQQQTQMQAQQEIAKAQMDAEYKLQEEKIKNQKQLLSMQEKYMKSQAKNAPAPAANQSPILANQLKRVVKKVNSLKVASSPEKKAFLQGAKNFFSDLGREVGDYWRDPKSYVSTNNPGLNNSGLWNSTLGYTTNFNSGLSNLARGNLATGAADLTKGVGQGALVVGGGGLAGAAGKTAIKSMAPSVARFATQTAKPLVQQQASRVGQFAAQTAKPFLQSKAKDIGTTVARNVANPVQSIKNRGLSKNLGSAFTGVFGIDDYNTRRNQGESISRAAMGTIAGMYGGSKAMAGTKHLAERFLNLPHISKRLPSNETLNALTRGAVSWPAQFAGYGLGAGAAGGAANAVHNMFTGEGDKLQERRFEEFSEENPTEFEQMGSAPQAMNMPSTGSYPGGFTAPMLPPLMDQGLSPDKRFMAAAPSGYKYAGFKKKAAGPTHMITGPEAGSDLTPILKRKPAPGEIPASPIPILQMGTRANQFAYPIHNPSKQQGYGPAGNFIRDLIFQYGLPMLGLPAFANPDFARLYGSMNRPESYRVKSYKFA